MATKSGVVFAFLTALLGASAAALAADSSKLPPLTSPSVGFGPTGDVTLYVGDKYNFYVSDRRLPGYLDPTKLDWEIDGQPAKDASPDEGTLTPGHASDGPMMIYRAPMKRPAKPVTISVLPPTDPKGQPHTATITITDQKNWIELDGDIPSKHEEVTIVPATTSSASHLDSGKFMWSRHMGYNAFFAQLEGTNKDDPSQTVAVILNMGPHGAPGTYGWTISNRAVGISVEMDDKSFGSTSIFDNPPHSLDGSTIILEPRPIDAPGLMRGSFSGQLCYVTSNGRNETRHFVTVHGHFAVMKK